MPSDHTIYRRASSELSADVAQRAYDKLAQLNPAEALDDLRVPPGNRLEKLSGDRAGQQSIRINRQYRVCFVREDGDAYELEVEKDRIGAALESIRPRSQAQA